MNKLRAALIDINVPGRHQPSQPVDPLTFCVATEHRPAFDIDRFLVVGARGFGKSCLAHAMVDDNLRAIAAKELKIRNLAKASVRFGFNGSTDAVEMYKLASATPGVSSASIWWAILARVVADEVGPNIHVSFDDLVKDAVSGRAASVIQNADANINAYDRKLVVVFDALETLESEPVVGGPIASLLEVAAAMQKKFRSIRCKVLVRPDQLATTSAAFRWNDRSLLELLNKRLGGPLAATHMALIPNLADANGDTSLITFLTYVREAARATNHESVPAVDASGQIVGFDKAAATQLDQFGEINLPKQVLDSLRGESIPLDRSHAEKLWQAAGLETHGLVEKLRTLGILSLRRGDRLDIPDIYRIRAGIKRYGGVSVNRK